MRVWRWDEAIAPARAAAKNAPGNSAAWVMLARCFGSVADDGDALAAATTGLELDPRDSDLLRTQATALAALHRPEARRRARRVRSFPIAGRTRPSYASRAPPTRRAAAREREQGHTHLLHPVR